MFIKYVSVSSRIGQKHLCVFLCFWFVPQGACIKLCAWQFSYACLTGGIWQCVVWHRTFVCVNIYQYQLFLTGPNDHWLALLLFFENYIHIKSTILCRTLIELVFPGKIFHDGLEPAAIKFKFSMNNIPLTAVIQFICIGFSLLQELDELLASSSTDCLHHLYIVLEIALTGEHVLHHSICVSYSSF